MEVHGLKQKDLAPIFKTRSIVSAVLNGKRALAAEHINLLAAFFHLPHELFFEPVETSEQAT
jgi:HTH-type transcriptional regulator/antitoxin HigA